MNLYLARIAVNNGMVITTNEGFQSYHHCGGYGFSTEQYLSGMGFQSYHHCGGYGFSTEQYLSGMGFQSYHHCGGYGF